MVVVVNKDEVVGVMIFRDIRTESTEVCESWYKPSQGLDTLTGWVYYSTEELRGYTSFCQHYGFSIVNSKLNIIDNSVGVVYMDIEDYPELVPKT